MLHPHELRYVFTRKRGIKLSRSLGGREGYMYRASYIVFPWPHGGEKVYMVTNSENTVAILDEARNIVDVYKSTDFL